MTSFNTLPNMITLAKTYRDHRRPMRIDEVLAHLGPEWKDQYFTACDLSERLIRLGILEVATRTDGLVAEAVFAPELSGENLEQFVTEMDELATEFDERKARIQKLESILYGIEAKIKEGMKEE